MSDDKFGPVERFGRSPENEIASVESLARMHKVLHGQDTIMDKKTIDPMDRQSGKPISATRAAEFIQGRTGEPAVDEMGFCNLCGKHSIADGS